MTVRHVQGQCIAKKWLNIKNSANNQSGTKVGQLNCGKIENVRNSTCTHSTHINDLFVVFSFPLNLLL